MTIGSILLSVALLLVVTLFVARPFLLAGRRTVDDLSQQEALEAQKEAVLAEIRALDFDYETGKVPEEEYEALRREQLAEAAQLLKALDALQPATVAGQGETVDDIEAAIARVRQKAVPEEDIEAAVARRRQEGVRVNGQKATITPVRARASGNAPAKRAGFCPECGQARDDSDKFCAYCGHAFA